MENQSILIHHVFFLLIFIISVGMASGRIAGWLKIPDVAVFLLAGIIVGQGLHLVHETSTSFTNQFILILGSTLILFDGGRNIRLSGLRKVWMTVALLSVPGVLITAAVVGFAAYYILGLPLLYAFLLAAVISSTDPATLIPVFKHVKIVPKVRETVESESAFNDATGSILTFTILAVIMGGASINVAGSIRDFMVAAGGGIFTGIIVGAAAAILVGHKKFGFLRDYATISIIVAALGSYLLGDVLHVSGFMATFVAGLMFGNSRLFGLHVKEEREASHFSDNITTIMRMLIFVLLGSQVNFQAIVEYFWASLAVIAVFMFIARPLTVFASALPDRKAKWTWREMLFMCWVRETGVIPAALSGMIAASGVKYADVISSVTFMAILLTILVQASTTAFVAKKLGLEAG
ncbi:cation:proton antiporter [Paenibacillus alkalitolerans]|uniref:cation:proton antiporter n=1 Tax=Paenibacillus alkalitolerans TaxID=2799335 RepID=UPI0018F2EB55|nr:sodium:proton antiporter [Paenibacillus alkalitolerans]